MTVKIVNRDDVTSIVKKIIGLKKPSNLDKIIDGVPKPRGAVPNFGLPMWKIMPLESKIPMIPGPEGSYNFTRRKLGKKLWIQKKNARFNMDDPCNYEMKLTYDSLHDEHLERYFARRTNVERMIELGFVTKNLDAKCSVKDYNVYRKFLKKLHSDDVNRELKRRSELADERRIIEFADFAARRDVERLKIVERKMLASEKIREEIRMQEEKKNQERRQREAELEKRKKSMALANEETTRERALKSKAREEHIRRKRAAAVENKKREIIKKFVARARKESKRKKMRKDRQAREAEERRRAIEEKWEQRKEQQIKEIATRQMALSYAEQQRQAFIESYNKKIERERTCVQKRFKKIRQLVGCRIARGTAGGKRRRCCRKLQGQMKDDSKAAVSNMAQLTDTALRKKAINNVRMSR